MNRNFQRSSKKSSSLPLHTLTCTARVERSRAQSTGVPLKERAYTSRSNKVCITRLPGQRRQKLKGSPRNVETQCCGSLQGTREETEVTRYITR
eukprot:328673-Amphidinium_carterae.1